MMKLMYLMPALAVIATQAQAADRANVVVAPVATIVETASHQPITLPTHDAKVIVAMFSIPPGAKLPAHKHPHIRYGYMESGVLRVSNLVTGKTDEYKAGDFIVDAQDQWHEAENPGKEPTKLLVIDQLDKDSKDSNTVMR